MGDEMLPVSPILPASVNRSPLARGALTGKYSKGTVFAENDVRRDEWSVEHFFVPTLDKLDAVQSILTSRGRTLAQGVLAWALTRCPRTIPIPGFRSVAQVKENAGVVQLSPFTKEQMQEIAACWGGDWKFERFSE